MKAPIVGILHSYCPTTGASTSNLIIRADGTFNLYGEASLASANLARLAAAPFPEPSTPEPLPQVERGHALSLPASLPVPVSPSRHRACRGCGHINEPAARGCASCTAPLPRRGRPPKIAVV